MDDKMDGARGDRVGGGKGFVDWEEWDREAISLKCM